MVMQTKDDVHISWTEIRDFEIRASSEINFDYQTDTNNSNISGEGIVFAGFVPRISDIFLYMMRNSKIGVFRVSDIQRLSLGQDTYHKINFTMQEFLTPSQRDQLRRQTTNIFYFDKTKFVAGNNALLTSRNFAIQKDLKHLRSEIIQNYMDRFYDPTYSSFMRPDKVYDPYVVEYWNKKVSFTENYTRPIQLLLAVNNYKKTIWSVLTNYPIKDLKNVSYDFDTFTYAATFWSVNVTSLLGNKFVTVGDETASKLETTIARNGKAILMDALPYFHSHQYDELLKKRAMKMFDAMRYTFYGPFLPHQKCAPHQHSVYASYCNADKCEECFIDKYGNKIPKRKKRAPFPIVSNEELMMMWCTMNNKEPSTLTLIDEAKYRGYIEWYRKTYPGTLSRIELEKEYRQASNMEEGHEFTQEEADGLLTYIAAYRKQFLPVLTDREVEILWRTFKRIPYEDELNTEQLGELSIYINQYREDHGRVPDDGIDIPDATVGGPITAEEVKAAGAVMYGDQIVVESISLSKLVTMMDQTAQEEIVPLQPGTNSNISVDKNNIYMYGKTVPLLFQPRFPHPRAHLHCHDVCHRECGVKRCNDTDGNTTITQAYGGLSTKFYLGSAGMDPFEMLLYKTITNKEVDPGRILEVLLTYLDWNDEDAFYRLLFALYLIDRALFWLRYHS